MKVTIDNVSVDVTITEGRLVMQAQVDGRKFVSNLPTPKGKGKSVHTCVKHFVEHIRRERDNV